MVRWTVMEWRDERQQRIHVVRVEKKKSSAELVRWILHRGRVPGPQHHIEYAPSHPERGLLGCCSGCMGPRLMEWKKEMGPS